MRPGIPGLESSHLLLPSLRAATPIDIAAVSRNQEAASHIPASRLYFQKILMGVPRLGPNWTSQQQDSPEKASNAGILLDGEEETPSNQ